MSTYERSGKVRVPKWWLDKVLPMLADPSIKPADVAKAASQHAGRRSAWGRDAISKFVAGTVRTIELTNGISAALQVPQPFFTAPSEAAASAMTLIVRREQAYLVDKGDVPRGSGGVAESEMRQGRVDEVAKPDAASSDNGGKSGRGVRARRSGKGRS